MVGVVQVTRIMLYQQSQKALEAKKEEETAKEVVQA